MQKLKIYFKFPSKEPYAWLVYWFVATTLYRLQSLVSYYRWSNDVGGIENITGGLILLAAGVVGIMTLIQCAVNLVRIVKKEVPLSLNKAVLTILLLTGMYLVYNPLMENLMHYLTNGLR